MGDEIFAFIPNPPAPVSGNPKSKKENLKPMEPDAQNAWALKIATVSGIPIRLHFTFLLMIIWFAASSFATYVTAACLLVATICAQ